MLFVSCQNNDETRTKGRNYVAEPRKKSRDCCGHLFVGLVATAIMLSPAHAQPGLPVQSQQPGQPPKTMGGMVSTMRHQNPSVGQFINCVMKKRSMDGLLHIFTVFLMVTITSYSQRRRERDNISC